KRYAESRLSVVEGKQGNSGNRDDRRTPLLILMAATALVLMIAMANAANLLLARSAQRRRELAIRAAMGAGRGELMGQITLRLLVAEYAGDDPIYFLTSRLEWPVLLFATALSILTGLIFGLYPAWEVARASL